MLSARLRDVLGQDHLQSATYRRLKTGRAASRTPSAYAARPGPRGQGTPRLRARLVALSAMARSVWAAVSRSRPTNAARLAATIAASSIVVSVMLVDVRAEPAGRDTPRWGGTSRRG